MEKIVAEELASSWGRLVAARSIEPLPISSHSNLVYPVQGEILHSSPRLRLIAENFAEDKDFLRGLITGWYSSGDDYLARAKALLNSEFNIFIQTSWSAGSFGFTNATIRHNSDEPIEPHQPDVIRKQVDAHLDPILPFTEPTSPSLLSSP